jgi:hypothetical protein
MPRKPLVVEVRYVEVPSDSEEARALDRAFARMAGLAAEPVLAETRTSSCQSSPT